MRRRQDDSGNVQNVKRIRSRRPSHSVAGRNLFECLTFFRGYHDPECARCMDGRRDSSDKLDAPTSVQIANTRFALCEAGYGFQAILRFKALFFANPSPTGEGAARRRVRGTTMKILRKTSKKFMWYPSPGPLTRATLSRWERDLPETFRLRS